MELQQSPPYLEYIKKLHWTVDTIDDVHIFSRKFPLAGTFAKMQRMNRLPSAEKVIAFIKSKKVKRIVLEAGSDLNQEGYFNWAKELRSHVTIIQSPYLPTKTLVVDVTPSEAIIFNKFSEAKRRAVRRAIKNNLTLLESKYVDQIIQIKNKSAGLFGFITTSGLRELWESFQPVDGITSVLAYESHDSPIRQAQGEQLTTHNSLSPSGGQLLAGICLVFWEKTAYYWIAGATKKGKKLFAPTLLAWEAMKIAKNRGMEQFDFVGIWDERFPKENKDWLGFTKFKEGFGGHPFYYPTHRTIRIPSHPMWSGSTLDVDNSYPLHQ